MSIKFCLLDIFYSFFTCQKCASLLSVRRIFVDIQEFTTFDKNLPNVLILQTDQAKRSFHGALRLCSNYSEIKKETYLLPGIQAGKLYCPVMAFFRIFLITVCGSHWDNICRKVHNLQDKPGRREQKNE